MNWNDLLANWKTKVMDMIAQMNAISFTELPDVVPVEWVKPAEMGMDRFTSIYVSMGITPPTATHATSAPQLNTRPSHACGHQVMRFMNG